MALPPADYQDGATDSYNFKALDAALRETEEKYGPYEIIRYERPIVSNRLLRELEHGKLSVAISAYKQAWEGKAVAVPFPMYRGLASYRMFFVSKDVKMKTAQVESLQDLKRFRFGQGAGWSTAKVLEDAGFDIVYSTVSDRLIGMLDAKRFELLMRSPAEILFEWPTVQKQSEDLFIEDKIAIYTYLPMYFYVPLDRPVLAERLEVGLKSLFESGQLDELMAPTFSEQKALIGQTKRKVFYLKNTNLKPGMYERDKPYLIDIGITHPQ